MEAAKTSDARVVVGSIVWGSDRVNYENGRLFPRVADFILKAWDASAFQNVNVLVFVEGDEALPPLQVERILIKRMSLEALEKIVANLENQDNKTASRADDGGPHEPHIFLAIGSPEYCQAFVHFFAGSRSGDVASWGVHLIRRLTARTSGDIVWYDTHDEGSFHGTTLSEIRSDAMDQFIRLCSREA